LRNVVFALTLNPSPIFGRGILKVSLPFSHIWEKGLGDEGKSFSSEKNYTFQDRRGLEEITGDYKLIVIHFSRMIRL
jgi:hypothetical protein